MIEFDTLSKKYIDAVYYLETRSIPCGWSKKAFESELMKDNVYYSVARDKTLMVGFCGICFVCGEADITNIAVEKCYQNCGIAGQLLKNIFLYCKNNGISKIHLEVRQSNIAAINLYLKYGFKKVGERNNYYSDTCENAIVMTKQL